MAGINCNNTASHRIDTILPLPWAAGLQRLRQGFCASTISLPWLFNITRDTPMGAGHHPPISHQHGETTINLNI